MRTAPASQVLAAPAIGDAGLGKAVLATVAILVIIGMVAVLVHRFIQQRTAATDGTTNDNGMTRPILAVLLVGTLLVLAAASLMFDDASSRNLLIGGVVSLSSGVVAFYFASSGASEARRDLLSATAQVLEVPDLVGKTITEAQAIVSRVHLALVLPDPHPAATAAVVTQDPPAGASVRSSQTIRVTVTS